jgi:hypothetical protein
MSSRASNLKESPKPEWPWPCGAIVASFLVLTGLAVLIGVLA